MNDNEMEYLGPLIETLRVATQANAEAIIFLTEVANEIAEMNTCDDCEGCCYGE